MAKIFPIPMSRHLAEDLIRRHCHAEFSHGWRSMTAVYSYSGKILDEDGNCAFTCTYNSDDGFVMSSGPIFVDLVKPGIFTKKETRERVSRRKVELAMEEREMRELARIADEVDAIHIELFGTSMPEKAKKEIAEGRN